VRTRLITLALAGAAALAGSTPAQAGVSATQNRVAAAVPAAATAAFKRRHAAVCGLHQRSLLHGRWQRGRSVHRDRDHARRE
jgi:hypothetical protein